MDPLIGLLGWLLFIVTFGILVWSNRASARSTRILWDQIHRYEHAMGSPLAHMRLRASIDESHIQPDGTRVIDKATIQSVEMDPLPTAQLDMYDRHGRPEGLTYGKGRR